MATLDNVQFLILSLTIAVIVYIGGVSRNLASSIKRDFYSSERSVATEKRVFLFSLIIADILLIAIAWLTLLRIWMWFSNILSPDALDSPLLTLITALVGYLTVLHFIQWIWQGFAVFGYNETPKQTFLVYSSLFATLSDLDEKSLMVFFAFTQAAKRDGSLVLNEENRRWLEIKTNLDQEAINGAVKSLKDIGLVKGNLRRIKLNTKQLKRLY